MGAAGPGTTPAQTAGHPPAAGHRDTVNNRTRVREEPLAAHGATRAESPGEAAIGPDLVLTCVSDGPDLEAVVLGPGGIAETLMPGAVLVDCSTVSPAVSRRLAAALAPRSAGAVDAPVSGGSEGAERGTLTAFVGGRDDDVARARPLLDAFCGTVTHLGPPGSGQSAKAVNQVLLAGAYASLGEALVLAEREGLPLDRLVEALGGGAARSWVLENRAANVIDDRYPLGFRVSLHLKDLRIALAQAEAAGLRLEVAELVARLEERLVERGYGGEDVSAVARVARGSA